MSEHILVHPNSLVLLGAAAGLLSHWGIFIRGEYHERVPSILLAAFTTLVAITILQIRLIQVPTLFALGNTALLSTSYNIALTASIVTYRLLFHPLRSFPGPPTLRISKIFHVFYNRNLKNFLFLDDLHKQYGEFVRTGPNEITIFNVAGLQALYGPQSKARKAAFYDNLKPNISLVTSRSRDLHHSRRRVWDKAFNNQALSHYESRVQDHVNELNRKISRSVGQSINTPPIFSALAMDIMTDVSFNKHYGLLETQDKSHPLLQIVEKGFLPLAVVKVIPWMASLSSCIPGAKKDWNDFVGWSQSQLYERMKTKPASPDIMTTLFAAEGPDLSPKTISPVLKGDAVVVVGAGSDTSHTSMCFLFHYLARHPVHVEKIREELRAFDHIPGDNELSKLPHLNAVITETLRLHPPLPATLPRDLPLEGIMVDGHHIPGGATCQAPLYTIARLESCFEQADRFIPERWTTQSHLTKNANAYAPFSIGPYNCPGKRIALMELRKVTADLITHFDVAFADGETGQDIFEKQIEGFTLSPGPLHLEFTSRESC